MLVSKELLRQTFGLEAPIVDVRLTDDEGVLEFIIGTEQGPQAQLVGNFMTHECPINHERWYAASYRVLEKENPSEQDV